jgi:hypothetical protein
VTSMLASNLPFAPVASYEVVREKSAAGMPRNNLRSAASLGGARPRHSGSPKRASPLAAARPSKAKRASPSPSAARETRA